MQPLLLPGTRVLRRDGEHLQIGVGPSARVVLPDSPALRRLETGEGLRGDPDLTARLAPVLLPDDAPLRAALPSADASSYDDPEAWSRHSLASLGRTGQADAFTLGRRASYAVMVQPALARTGRHRTRGLTEALADELLTLCRRSGLRAGRVVPPGPRASRPPFVRAVVAVGEPDRRLLDGVEEPHLLVRFVEGDAVVGPFVEPGETSCLRCVDAHLTREDSAWPLLVEQLARLGAADRADGVPEPVDAALAAVALGWATRELASYVDGETPVTSGQSLRLRPGLIEVETQEWPRSPECGCAPGRAH